MGKSNSHSRPKTKTSPTTNINLAHISTLTPKFSIISFLSWSMITTNYTPIPPNPKTSTGSPRPPNITLKMKISMISSLPVSELSPSKRTTLPTLSPLDTPPNNLQNPTSTSTPPRDSHWETRNQLVLKRAPFTVSTCKTSKGMEEPPSCSGISPTNTPGTWSLSKSTPSASRKNMIFSTSPSTTG